MNENRSYNSKAHKNKGAGMLMHSFACKYYFLIAIFKGTKEIWTQAPSEGKQATQLKIFSLSASVHVILNGVVVIVLVTCAGSPSSNPWVVTYFFPLASTFKSFVFIICITFLLILKINWKKEGRFLSRKVLKIWNH
jgi:hypothetical protein